MTSSPRPVGSRSAGPAELCTAAMSSGSRRPIPWLTVSGIEIYRLLGGRVIEYGAQLKLSDPVCRACAGHRFVACSASGVG